MNQYVKFIVRVLLTCFFIAFLGGIIQVLCGLEQYLWGWFWGIFIMVLYLLSLALHGQSIVSGDSYKAVRKARRQMIWRLMLVGSLVVLGLLLACLLVWHLFSPHYMLFTGGLVDISNLMCVKL